MKKFLSLVLLGLVVGCGSSGSDSSSSSDDSLAGGGTTTDDRTSLAFENPATNLSEEETVRHIKGDGDFASIFVSGQAAFNGGLGPLFNANSCDSCHTKNGRGQPLFNQGSGGSQAVIKISEDGVSPELPDGPNSSTHFGGQLQDQATFGNTPEAKVILNWKENNFSYPDGRIVALRSPEFRLQDAIASTTGLKFSLRTAPPVFGAGLLEALSDDYLRSLEDPNDANGDGVSGRTNQIYDILSGVSKVGKFGRKANNPSLVQQSAGAYFNDMGLTNHLFPGPDNSADVSLEVLQSVVFYVQTIAVPKSVTSQSIVAEEGRELFATLGCVSCHIPSHDTGIHDLEALSNQKIYPYTDLLLHDMGDGLADNRSDFLADGREWKTPALWGIGISSTILASTATYLHDGRARTLEEAVLWHGGEADGAKLRFINLSFEDREKVIKFLESL